VFEAPDRTRAFAISKLYSNFITVLIGEELFCPRFVKLDMKGGPMFIIALIITILLVALAGANLLIENIGPDELSNMGIEEK
jgi:hypothetical protein